MKRILLIIGLLISVNLMFAQPTITVEIGSVLNPPAGPVQVPVTITQLNNPVIGSNLVSSLGFFIAYDAAVLGNTVSFIYPSPAPFPGAVTNVTFNYPQPGWNTISFVYAAATSTNVVVPQVIINLGFTYTSGGTDLLWGDLPKKGEEKSLDSKSTNIFTDDEGNDFVATLIPGFIGTPGGGCTPGLWTGMGDGTNWFDAANWDCNEVPVNIDVEIPGGTKAMVTISGGVATTAALIVGFGGGLVIAPNGGLTTNGLYTNNGSLLIQSDLGPGFSGTFIDNGGIAGGGTFEFDRNVLNSGTLAGTGNPFGWHYLSAPFNGFSTNQMNDYFINVWNQGGGVWNQYSMVAPCTPWPNTPLGTENPPASYALDSWSVNLDLMYPYTGLCTPPLAPGTGVQVEYMSGAGGVHTGAYTKPLGFGAGLQKWNLVGNPYPSGLDVNTIAFGPNTVAATYFYEGVSGNYFYWATGLGSYKMPATNGFFVETTGADVFSVGNASRAHGADFFYKNEATNLLTLQASGNEKTDVLYVRFADDVTAGFDNNGDAHKLFAETDGIPQIYTVAGNEMLAINALPETASVPMGFVANGSGTYTIEAVETSDFQNVVLEDLFTGIETDLLASNYPFEYNVDDNANRFVIHFTPLGTPELGANNINIWAANQTIYVQAPATTGDIVVYNMMGQVVVKTAIEAGLNEIPMNDANTYYIVKVLGSDVTETGKVFIK